MPIVRISEETYQLLTQLSQEDKQPRGQIVADLVARRAKDERKWDHLKGETSRPYAEDRLFTALKIALDNRWIEPIQAVKIWRQVTLCDLREAAQVVKGDMMGKVEIVLYTLPNGKASKWVSPADFQKFVDEGLIPDVDGNYLTHDTYLAKHYPEIKRE